MPSSTVTAESSLPSLLENKLPRGLDYYSEFIDQARFRRPGYEDVFRDFLRTKYREQHIDAVIPLGQGAIQFLADSRDALFPNTPVLFYTAMPLTERMANSTGIVNVFRLDRTIELALALQPDLRQLFVVTGAAAADRRMERQARADFERFKGRLEITYLAGLATSELEARLQAVPPHSAVFYGLISEDGRGQTFQTTDYLTRLTALSQCAHLQLGRHLHGNRYRRRESTQPTGTDQDPRRDDPSRPRWRARRRHPDFDSRYGCQPGRLAPAPALGHQRIPRAPRHARALQGTLRRGTATRSTSSARQRCCWLRRSSSPGCSSSDDGAGWPRLRCAAAKRRYATPTSASAISGSRLLHAQDTERSRIARELHDDISQQIALLSIDLELLSAAVPSDTGALAGEALDRVHEIARSVHDLSHQLHPAKLRLIGLVGALQSLQRELSRSGQTITFTHEQVPSRLPPDLTVTLFRVVQEALQNAIKHSRARTVSVDLRGGADGLALTVADDGAGFAVDEAWGKGLGLMSIGERVEAVGGTFDIQSRAGGGTSVTITVPLASVEATVGVAAGSVA